MQKGGAKAVRDKAICRALASPQVEGWVGMVTKVDSNSDGKGVLNVAIAKGIRLETSNNEFSDIRDHTLLEPGTALFQAASSLKNNEIVSFSSSFIPNRQDCIDELSLTLDGKTQDPEFMFRFSGIGPYVAARSREIEQSPPDAPQAITVASPEPRTSTAQTATNVKPGPPANKDFDSAERTYRQILKNDPNNATIIKALAEILYREDRINEAAALLDRLPH